MVLQSAAANVNSWAALGDSYASGIGAGVRRDIDKGDKTCSRYTEGYPDVVNVVLDGTGPDQRTFNWVACSGAKTGYVKSTEVPAIDGDIDMATLTIGGNDIGFFDILNACIFQFGWLVGGAYTSCEDQLAGSSDQIKNNLPSKLDSTILAILSQVSNSGFKLYMTGYAAFWNNETTPCNNVSFNFWETKPEDRANLTQELRTSMNDMLGDLNAEISAAVKRANNHDERKPVVFVDYNDAFSGHRYCEEGMKEPDPDNEDRWFQENWLFKQHQPYSANNISTYYQSLAAAGQNADPSITISSANKNVTTNGTVDIYGDAEWIFDALARAFHPTIDGHDGIRLEVLSAYTGSPPGPNCDGCVALQSATSVVGVTTPTAESTSTTTPASTPASTSVAATTTAAV